jgi:hypothetical protein
VGAGQQTTTPGHQFPLSAKWNCSCKRGAGMFVPAAAPGSDKGWLVWHLPALCACTRRQPIVETAARVGDCSPPAPGMVWRGHPWQGTRPGVPPIPPSPRGAGTVHVGVSNYLGPFMSPPSSPFPEKCNSTLHGMATWCAPRHGNSGSQPPCGRSAPLYVTRGAATPESLSA